MPASTISRADLAIDGAGDIAECWRPCPAGAYRAGGLKKIHFFSGQSMVPVISPDANLSVPGGGVSGRGAKKNPFFFGATGSADAEALSPLAIGG